MSSSTPDHEKHPNAGRKRLGHRKSRNGCARCKKRRVKCDEEIPCSACATHGTACSLGQRLESPSEASVAANSMQRSGEGGSAAPANSCTSSPQPSLNAAPLSFLTESPECWVSNAELIIHYTTVAYRTLCFSDSLADFLQYDLPREAIRYPFLLRQIMAYSGLHLAYLHPETRSVYLLRASKQQDRAIKGLREELSGPINPQNCHVLYAASIFLILSKFAMFAADETQHQHHSCVSPIGNLLEIFTTITGMDAVFRPSEDLIRQSPLGGMFHRGPGVESIQLLCLQRRLAKLKSRVEAEALQFHEMTTLLAAIDSLVTSTVRCSSQSGLSSPAEFRAAFLWPMLVERKLLEMVEADHPIALVILAHYSVLIHWPARKAWCFERWARSVIDEIAEKISVTSWAAWIDWPLSILNEELE